MNRAVVIRATAGLAAHLAATGSAGRAGHRRVRRPAPLGPLRRATRRRCWPPPGSPCSWPTARCPPPSWRSASPTWAAAPASRSPPATTRPATTATRSTWATAPRSCRRPTRRSRPTSTPWGRSTRCPGPRRTTRASSPPATRWSTPTSPGALAQVTAPEARDLRLVYTPLHGVGPRRARRVLVDAGFDAPAAVRRPGRARPRLPDRGLPQPRGAGRARPGAGAGGGRARRPGRRQRSRRRPPGRRGARSRGPRRVAPPRR